MPLTWSRRQLTIASVLAVLAIVLIFEIIFVLPQVLQVWHPWDYGNYVEMGRAVREGRNPYGVDRYYPLPTMLWIFMPLSLMPEWFRLVWILVPAIFVLVLDKWNGILWFFFPPLWFVASDAMFDAWLLMPLAWVMGGRMRWAGIGAALLLFKPHVTFVLVGYACLLWLARRDWTNLKTFAATMTILWLPSFLVNWQWPLLMLDTVMLRIGQANVLPLINVSIWSWWSLGGIGWVFFALIVTALCALTVRAWRTPSTRAATIQLVSLALNPIMLGSNLVTAMPTVRTRTPIIALVLASWVAFFINSQVELFGGGYLFVTLIALYFQTRTQETLEQP